MTGPQGQVMFTLREKMQKHAVSASDYPAGVPRPWHLGASTKGVFATIGILLFMSLIAVAFFWESIR